MAASDFPQVTAAKAAFLQAGVRLGPIGLRDRATADFHAAILGCADTHIAHRRADERRLISRSVAVVVRDAAAFGCAIKIVQLESALRENLLLQTRSEEHTSELQSRFG